jgi:hypothetical protein
MKIVRIVSAIVVLALASTAHASGAQPAGVSDIDWAVSAAPASIGAAATVVNMSDDGKVTELRRGTNGWTCVVHDPGTPSGHPLCVDQNGLEWMQAAMSGREPDAAKAGYSYMLKGGTAWSATDVTATKLPEGQKDVIRVPPHIMIMNARIADASGFPSAPSSADFHKPFVFYGGTPYAILIIPVE